MTITQRIEGLIKTWNLVLPHIPAPSERSAARWLHYEDLIVELAIMRTAQKFSEEKLSPGFKPEQAHKYVTATARTMAERKKMTQETQDKIQANRLAILTEVNKNFSHHVEAFDLVNILDLIESFEPTGNLKADVQRFLNKLELAHSFQEYDTAKDGFAAQAKRLVDTHGANATMADMQQALAKI